MDFTYFIQNKHLIEPANKAGLYCIMQNHLPANLQAYRCGLAGLPKDSATSVSVEESSFASRFAGYLNYWLPTDAKIYALLTVDRQSIQGFTQKVLPPRQPGDNRPDYARGGTTLIQIREKQYHQLLKKNKLKRIGLPGTAQNKIRSEFFRGELQNCIRSLREIGTGDLYIFNNGNNINSIKKIELKKRNIEEIVPEQVVLRSSPRFTAKKGVINKLTAGDTVVAKALEKLALVVPRRSARNGTQGKPNSS